MKRLGAAFGVLALVACEAEPTQRPTPPAPPSAPAATAPAPPPAVPAPKEGWTMQASAAAGAALIWTANDGGESLRIACRRNPSELWVSAPRFQRIGSEERLSVGAGGEAFALVADLRSEGAGVEAAGPLPAGFLQALGSGAEVGVSYGNQAFQAPWPGAALARRFSDACSAGAASG